MPPAAMGGGCGCTVAGDDPGWFVALSMSTLGLATLAVRRRRRR
jgi:MYXO-CTERM domain-containing protein